MDTTSKTRRLKDNIKTDFTEGELAQHWVLWQKIVCMFQTPTARNLN